jgi:hypothetical protein
MVAIPPSSSVNDLPREAVAAAEANASRDADRVIQFLDAFCAQRTPGKPLPITLGFLLHLAAALRLLAWEAQGFFFHRAAGLPEGQQALRHAFLTLTDSDGDPHDFCVAVLRVTLERFAWNGPQDLDSEVVLDDLPDDAALDALAELLWATRHSPSVGHQHQP